MSYARIRNFSQPAPVRSDSARTGRRRLSADGRYLNLGNVLTFTRRPKPTAPILSEPSAGAALRVSLEEAAQVALDAADRIIAVLDRVDGDPSLVAPENATGSQVVYMRGNDQDREEEAPETVLPEVTTEPQPQAVVLPWRGRGNVIAAAGSLLVDLPERA